MNTISLLSVKYDYFRSIFVKDFNISFKSPATDACSECIRLTEMIKVTSNPEDKQLCISKLRVHKLKAKAFYSMLKVPVQEDEVRLSFDCQKNLVLPKVPDQSAYYSRQLYFYNFTICEGSSKNHLNPSTVTSYTWMEHERTKGSNEIASMVYNKLESIDLSGKTTIQLFCDGCPGQNENFTMIGMLMTWLSKTKSKVTKVTVVYPIVGHSFLPPDRVFGQVEKKLRQMDTIVSPVEYRDVLTQFSTVKAFNEDFKVYDWKEEVKSTVKPPGQWHFKISTKVKRIEIIKQKKGIVIKGEVPYRLDVCIHKSVLKKCQILSMINPTMIETKNTVKPEKLKDVDELLKKHFGESWKEREDLKLYKQVLEEKGLSSQDVGEELDDENDFPAEDDEDDFVL